MNHPPYHLRANKAVDRFLLIEALRRLNGLINVSDYTYYGFGGPFLEDCRLLHEYFPELSLVSLEKDGQTYRRQEFHKFSKDVVLKKMALCDFLPQLKSQGKEILWLDYTDMSWDRIREFMELLDIANNGTVIKVTVRADGGEREMAPIGKKSSTRVAEFRIKIEQEFAEVCPTRIDDKELCPGELPTFFQRLFQIAAEKALPASVGSVFQPIDSVRYSDGTTMLSITGIVWPLSKVEQLRKKLEGWRFANLSWEPPRKVAMPILSVKERLFLEAHISAHGNDERGLVKVLGYDLGDGEEDTLKKLGQYADFHRYYPYFAKVTV